MDARDISLQVAAPAGYYTDPDLHDCLSRAREGLLHFDIGSTMEGLSMSIDVLAFPEWFKGLPFTNGEDVCVECDTGRLTDAGRMVSNVFDGLASVCLEDQRACSIHPLHTSTRGSFDQ